MVTGRLLTLVSLLLLSLLMACGGGGDGSAEEQSSNVLADAGEDQFVLLNAAVTLDGSQSLSDPDTELTYAWSFTSTPDDSAVVLINANTESAAFVPDVEGTYVVQLAISGGTSANQIDTVSIVAGVFPTVETEFTNRFPGPIPDGMKVSCWTGEDGARSNMCPELVYNDVNYWAYSFDDDRYSLRIVGYNADRKIVYDREIPTIRHIRGIDVNIAEQSVTFRGEFVSGEEGAATLTWQELTSGVFEPQPEADAGPNQIYVPGDTVTLDGSESYGSSPLSYAWSFDSTPAGSAAVLSDSTDSQPTFIADIEGTYVLNLIVNDGTTDSLADTVIITSSNIPLIGSELVANPPGNIPEDMKVTCQSSPGLASSVCPVLLYNDLTYWAFSYIDNRYPLGIVGFDAAGNVVSQQELAGTRYIWQITVDVDTSTVLFYGDNFFQNSVSLLWSEL